MTPETGRDLFVVSAPSGAGKSTLTMEAVRRLDSVRLSISCTTRPPRGDERHGREYFFLTEEEFFDRKNLGDFLEWAQVHGHYYGTSRSVVEDLLRQGFKVIFDIDVQGAARLKTLYPDGTLIFIAPPSLEELRRRLIERKTDDPKEIERRLRNAQGELVEAGSYDHVILNDDLARASDELCAILAGKVRPDPEANRRVLARLLGGGAAMSREAAEARFEEILTAYRTARPDADLPRLRLAFQTAALWHGEQKRENGELYLFHPVEVAAILADLRLDSTTLVTALLHDVREDTAIPPGEIPRLFGEETAFLVDGVTKLTRINFRSRKEQQVQSLRKMFLAMSSDLRVILVKLADRLHNLRTLDGLKDPDTRLAVAQETLDVYSPIASRLGMQRLKGEMEDRAFKTLLPAEYASVVAYVEGRRREEEKLLAEIEQTLVSLVTEHGLKARVYGRTKHPYSIYRKMLRKNIEIDQLYDLIAFRVIVDSLEACYLALGLVHARWRPIQGLFEDYVAMPKPNGYQSLHTIVVGPLGDRMEIQIRTEGMHEVAENGVAAHWKYKETGAPSATAARESTQVSWLRRLIETQQELDDPEDFFDSLRLDLFSDYVFVFTPRGEVVELPVDSTPVDFAYAVHTQVGYHCQGAKVNGRIAPLRYKLKNGEVVEIITHKDQRPRKEWLEFVKTGRAKAKIRYAVQEEERERNRKLGRELIEQAFRRVDLNLNRLHKEGRLDEAAQKLKAKDFEEVLILVARGQLGLNDLIRAIAPEKVAPPAPSPRRKTSAVPRKTKAKTGLRIAGVEEMLIHYARCCNPVRGDEVTGFITRGRGVTIHRRDCPKIPSRDPDRLVEAVWEDGEEAERPVTLRVVSRDRAGLLREVSEAFSKRGINILSVAARAGQGGQASIGLFRVQVKSLDELESVRRELRRLKGVIQVERTEGG